MEIENDKKRIEEIEEEEEIEESTPLITESESVNKQVREVEINLYKQGKGPIDVFKAKLVGYELDQLEVREILEKYGFKSLFAFSPDSGRGVPIRFNRRNGRSLLTYKDGSVVHFDGEPQVIVVLFFALFLVV